jgi:hypothetical protein
LQEATTSTTTATNTYSIKATTSTTTEMLKPFNTVLILKTNLELILQEATTAAAVEQQH